MNALEVPVAVPPWSVAVTVSDAPVPVTVTDSVLTPEAKTPD